MNILCEKENSARWLARLARVAVVSGKHEKYFSPSANLCRRALLFCRGSGVDRSNSEPHASRLNPGGLEEAQKGMLLATYSHAIPVSEPKRECNSNPDTRLCICAGMPCRAQHLQLLYSFFSWVSCG